ncbi:peptidase U32 family protein [Desulfolithobacter sp.]
MKKIELLAPAGSIASFEAALEEGADAVYVGAPGLNARALAKDFSFAELRGMIQAAHDRGRNVHIAMNSLVREDELLRAVEALSLFSQLRPDALIVQDLGLAWLAQRFFPHIPLHASTLMSVHNSMTAGYLRDLGFSRVVLARELTLDEIRRIGEESGAELEIFIHGAMCFSFSGLCLFSSLHGGKSSLRGQCVQPCRRRYGWQEGRRKKKGGGYLFSMNDLCGIDLLPQMCRAGVASLKIEGRMKSAEYVRKTVRAYRLVIDSLDQAESERRRVLKEAHGLLDEAMGRRRSPGFFLAAKPKQAVTPALSGNTGKLVARVQRLEALRHGRQGTILTARLLEPVRVGERLRLHHEQSGERKSFTVRTMRLGRKTVRRAGSGQLVRFVLDQDLGMQSDSGFRASLFRVDVERRLQTSRSADRYRVAGGAGPRPDRALVEKIVEVLEWAEEKNKKPAQGSRNRVHWEKRRKKNMRKGQVWWVRVAHLRDAGQRFPVRPVRILVPMTRENIDFLNKTTRLRKPQSRIVWELPPLIMEDALGWFGDSIQHLLREGFTRFQLGHVAQLGLFPEEIRGQLKFSGSYTLNILNSAALQALVELGLRNILFSLETDHANMAAALVHFRRTLAARKLGPGSVRIGMEVYGRPPLFTARLDGDHFRYGQQCLSPMDERFRVEQQDGLTVTRSVWPFSLLPWLGELREAGVDYLLADLSGGAISREITGFATLLRGNGRMEPTLSGNFAGHLL